jgi:hypothetical protein
MPRDYTALRDSHHVSRRCIVPVDRQGSHTSIMNKSKSAKNAVKLNQTSKDSKALTVPVAKGMVRRIDKPVYLPLPNGDIRVQHREYIKDISGSVLFTVEQLDLNPGLFTFFPWLASIASRYESYVFNKLGLEFETSAPTSSTGTIIIGVDYDAAVDDGAPSSKTQIMAWRNTVRSPPWSNCKFSSTSEDLKKRKTYYVRTGVLPDPDVANTYDVGRGFICTQGQASGAVIGEMYVSYDVTLMTPQLNDLAPGQAVWQFRSGTSNSDPFATIFSGNMRTSHTASGTNVSSTVIAILQPWEGILSIIVVGTGLSAITISGTALQSTNWTIVNSAGTNSAGNWSIRAPTGVQNAITIDFSNTTVTSSLYTAAQANV